MTRIEQRAAEIMAADDFEGRVRTLRDEAVRAGDDRMAATCDRWLLTGVDRFGMQCARAIAEAEAQS